MPHATDLLPYLSPCDLPPPSPRRLITLACPEDTHSLRLCVSSGKRLDCSFLPLHALTLRRIRATATAIPRSEPSRLAILRHIRHQKSPLARRRLFADALFVFRADLLHRPVECRHS